MVKKENLEKRHFRYLAAFLTKVPSDAAKMCTTGFSWSTL